MAKRDRENEPSLLGDLFRESPWIGLGVLLGLIAGGVGYLWIADVFRESGMSAAGTRRFMVLPFLGLLVGGAFVGLLVGVGVDSLVKLIRGKPDDKPRRRRRARP
jgi:hypothetical protein